MTDLLEPTAALTTRPSGVRAAVLLLAALACGLQAGTYYTWASGVMPGLGRVDDRTFVTTMQSINLAIVNPVFLVTFFGAPILAAVALFLTPGRTRALVGAGLVLAIATLIISIAGNIPLNDALAAVGGGDVSGLAADKLAAARDAFESRWVLLNTVRALTATGSLAALVWAAIRA